MTIQLAKAKTVRKKRTETELQQKLKKLNPYIRRSFISRDLMMYAELFCEDRKGCLLDIRFRRLCSTSFEYARIHNDIMCDDKSDKKRLLRLAQVRYRLLAILNAVNAAKDDANIVARCFAAHISNGNRLLSALSVCDSSFAVSDCNNTLSIDCKDGDRIDLFRMHEIIQDALSHFDGEMQRLDIKVENLEIDCGMDIYMKTK